MKYLIILLFSTALFSQTKTFIIKDCASNKVLPFASIDLLNGYGVYSNDSGEIAIDTKEFDSFKVSYLGYQPRILKVADLKDTICFEAAPIDLKEVVILKKEQQKKEEFKVKPKKHKDYLKCLIGYYAQQLAFFIPNPKESSLLNSISIPIFDPKILEMYGTHCKTLIKIEFLENKADLPGNNLTDFVQYEVIDVENTKSEFKIKLNEDVEIPANGLFASVTIIGKVDQNNKLIVELPYDEGVWDGKKQKVLKVILPGFPLVESTPSIKTFYRYTFNESKKWYEIEHSSFYIKGKIYPMFSIGIGYTTASYE